MAATMASRLQLWTLISFLFTLGTPSSATAQSTPESDVNSIPMLTQKLEQPYVDYNMQSRWWDFGGSTVIRTSKSVRLTGPHPSQAGWVFNRVPLAATNWEIEVDFNIEGATSGSLFGDGMAMWITKERAEQGPVFGMKDNFEGLGVFIDTYKNNRPGVVFPYVMAMMGDGQTSYDQANDGKANELAGCSARGLRNADFQTKMKVTYFQEKQLTVDLMYKKEGEWTRCFEIPNVKMPSVAYLGFSAETGELSEVHEIVQVTTRSLYSASGQTNVGSTPPAAGTRTSYQTREKETKESGGWLWTFAKFILFGLVLAGAYVGYTIWRSSRRDRF